MTDTIAIVGAGLVGRAWAIVFARSGLPVRLFDLDADISGQARDLIAASLDDLASFELIDDPAGILNRISAVDTLADALDGATYVQESVFERVETKQQIYREIDAVIGAETIVGSSSSGIPASAFTGGLSANARYLIAHPVNPPHLARVVELVPAPWTAPESVDAAWSLMERVDQVPVRVNGEIDGFILNRLQGVLLDEAFRLVRDGYVSATDLDKTIAHGLGLRWSFIGPFETIDLNAPDGIADYVERLGPLYSGIVNSRSVRGAWDDDLVTPAVTERRAHLPQEKILQRQMWRDRQMMALAAHHKKLSDTSN